MNLLYFDCFAGVSGDMVLGALLDLGLPMKHLTEGLAGLGLRGYSLRASRVSLRLLETVAGKTSHRTIGCDEVDGVS